MRRKGGYSAEQIGLHWIIAALVAAQFLLNGAISGAWAARLEGREAAFSVVVALHVAGGVLILALLAWRLVLRLRHGAPPAPANEPAPLRVLSHVVHWGFYLVLAAMTVSGGMAWFGNLPAAAQVHGVLKAVLLAMIVLHILAVPFQKLVLGNNVMQRMMRPGA